MTITKECDWETAIEYSCVESSHSHIEIEIEAITSSCKRRILLHLGILCISNYICSMLYSCKTNVHASDCD